MIEVGSPERMFYQKFLFKCQLEVLFSLMSRLNKYGFDSFQLTCEQFSLKIYNQACNDIRLHTLYRRKEYSDCKTLNIAHPAL